MERQQPFGQHDARIGRVVHVLIGDDAQAFLQRHRLQFVAPVDDPSPFVVAKGFEESSVGLKVYFWIDPVDTDFLKARSEAIAGIKKSFQEAGIEIPFPIVTINAPTGA